MMTNIGTRGIRILTWFVCVPLMVLIGIVQAVGTVLAAISAVFFKAISTLMVFVSLILLVFGLFTWMQTLTVIMIGVSMFWIPEGIAIIVLGLSFIQAKLRDLIESY